MRESLSQQASRMGTTTLETHEDLEEVSGVYDIVVLSHILEHLVGTKSSAAGGVQASGVRRAVVGGCAAPRPLVQG